MDGNVTGYDQNDRSALHPRMMQPHLHPDKPVGPVAKRYLLDTRILSVLQALMREEPYAVQSMFYFKPPGAWTGLSPGQLLPAGEARHLHGRVDRDRRLRRRERRNDVRAGDRLRSHCLPGEGRPVPYFTTEHVPIPEGKTAVLPLMKAGDVLFFNGSTIHGSGPNTSTTRFRRSLICHYVPQSTTEMSHWYKVFDAEGKPVPIKTNEDGGPRYGTHGAAEATLISPSVRLTGAIRVLALVRHQRLNGAATRIIRFREGRSPRRHRLPRDVSSIRQPRNTDNP